jgi:HNH endonuclease
MADLPAELLIRLRRQVGNRCGYCRTSVLVTGQPLTVEHIIPLARGGSSQEDNLWLSCRRCNEHKGIQIDGIDPDTGERVPVFHPRRQAWREHFAWSGDGTQIIGLTPCGRATVLALKLNNDDMVAARRLWVSVGWHPPDE